MTALNVVPANLEEDLIGLLLAGEGERYFDIAERLRPEHFAGGMTRAAFAAIEAVHRSGSSFSLSLVEDRMPARGPEGATVSAYLMRLAAEAPYGVHTEDLADVLIDRWCRETLAKTIQTLPKMIADQSIPGESLVEEVVGKIAGAFADQRPDEIYSAEELAEEFLADLSKPVTPETEAAGAFLTGFRPVDDLLGPFEPGGVTVIAGATSMGKSALAQQIAWSAAEAGVPILFHTNEMTARQAFERCACQIARVSSEHIKRRTLDREGMDRLTDATARIREMPISFDGKEKPTVASLKLRTQRMMRRKGVRALVIDHLQFVSASRKGMNEFEVLSDNTSAIKAMAKQLGVHVFLVSHLNRAGQALDVKTSADIRRPRLTDLHGSSSIEKDADNVLFVHRPVYYLDRASPDSSAKHHQQWEMDRLRWVGKAELIKAKRRGGSGFAIEEVQFVEACTLFVDTRNPEWHQTDERFL